MPLLADLLHEQNRLTAVDRFAARIEQVRYDTGVGTIEDLLLVRAREVSARASLARARGALVTAVARLNAIAEQEVVP